jgi:hypothetical protein
LFLNRIAKYIPFDMPCPRCQSLILLALVTVLLASCGRIAPRQADADGVSRRKSPSSEGASYKDCPPEGTGGDARLNLLKNRDAEPVQYESRNIEDLLAFKPTLLMEASPHSRASWPDDALAAAAKEESKGVKIEGHLLMARESGPESCNCGRDDLRDWHVWIGPERAGSFDEAKRMRNMSIVAEPTPRWQARHGWRLRQMQALARQSARVRVYGWLLWDQEHPEETPWMKGERATRGTLWEVHPVTKIEVLTAGKWVELGTQFIE